MTHSYDFPRTTICALQARLSSSRLPKKVLIPINGKTILEKCYQRAILGGFNPHDIYLATSSDNSDDPLVEEFSAYGLKSNICRGSLHNLLSRYCQLSISAQALKIVRITCDNPLVNPACIKALKNYLDFNPASCEGHYYFDSRLYSYGETPDAFTFPPFRNVSEVYRSDFTHPINYLNSISSFPNGICIPGPPSLFLPMHDRVTIDTQNDLGAMCTLISTIEHSN